MRPAGCPDYVDMVDPLDRHSGRAFPIAESTRHLMLHLLHISCCTQVLDRADHSRPVVPDGICLDKLPVLHPVWLFGGWIMFGDFDRRRTGLLLIPSALAGL